MVLISFACPNIDAIVFFNQDSPSITVAQIDHDYHSLWQSVDNAFGELRQYSAAELQAAEKERLRKVEEELERQRKLKIEEEQRQKELEDQRRL